MQHRLQPELPGQTQRPLLPLPHEPAAVTPHTQVSARTGGSMQDSKCAAYCLHTTTDAQVHFMCMQAMLKAYLAAGKLAS